MVTERDFIADWIHRVGRLKQKSPWNSCNNFFFMCGTSVVYIELCFCHKCLWPAVTQDFIIKKRWKRICDSFSVCCSKWILKPLLCYFKILILIEISSKSCFTLPVRVYNCFLHLSTCIRLEFHYVF